MKTLTIRTVFALPPGEADPVPRGVTGVVAEGVIPGSAVVRAGLAVVMLVANYVIGVPELTLLPEMDIL